MAKRKAEAEEEIDSQLPPDCDSDSTLILGGGAEDESPVLEGSQVTESRDVAAKKTHQSSTRKTQRATIVSLVWLQLFPIKMLTLVVMGPRGDEKKPLSLPRKKTCIYN